MKRVLTALLLIPAILFAVYLGPGWTLGVTGAVALLCFREYGTIVAAHGLPGLPWWSYAAGAGLLVLPREAWLIGVVSLVLLLLASTLRLDNLAHALPHAAAVTLGLGYVFGAWRCALLVREQSPHWLTFALLLNWLGDTAALCAGRAWGRRQLAPRISPKKTWEGAAASLATATLVGWLFLWQALPLVPWWHSIPLSAAAGLAGQVGDLAESALKRGAGIKDSGSMLPGHGGWLDRVDSTLFALPVVLLYLACQ